MGPSLLQDRLTAQRHSDFPEVVLPWLLEYVLPAVRQRFWLQHDGATSQYGEDSTNGRTQRIKEDGLDVEDRLHELISLRR